MYTETYCQSDAFVLFKTGIQGSYRLDDSQPGADSSLCIVFVCLRIAKIDQEPISKELGDMPLIALDDLGTGSLICTDHVPILFRVELAGEYGRVHQITKQHGELAAFGLRGLGRVTQVEAAGGAWAGGGWDTWGQALGGLRATRPDQDSTVLIDGEPLALDEFVLEILQIVVVEVELALERAIGHAPTALEHGDRLVEDLLKGHRPPSLDQ